MKGQRQSKRYTGGFTVLELTVVLALMAVLLTVSVPNMWEYYQRQRFDQSVQGVAANAKAAAMSAITSGFWYLIDIEDNCAIAGNGICIRIARLPMGECSLTSAINWSTVSACTETTPVSQVCEMTRLRSTFQSDIAMTPAQKLYIASPFGRIFTYQTNQLVCTVLPAPTPLLQMTFQTPRTNPKWKRGLCVYSSGIFKKTNASLTCT